MVRRVADEGVLEVRQTVDPDGYARLSLLGEFDQANSDGFLERLGELKRSGESVRVDLSELEFIDSSGVQAVLRSVRDAEGDGWRLEVDPRLSWQVKQVFDVLGLDTLLWPQGPERA
jgi:anti-anti-sigma factor